MNGVIFRQNEIIVFAVAVALRLAATFALGELPISRTPQLDSAAYLSWARAIVESLSYWPEYPEHAPGYPMFLALVLALSGGSLTAVRVVQSVLGAAGCVLTARVAARTLSPKAFLPAGLLQAAYAPLIYVETALLSESLLIFLLILTVDLVTRKRGQGSFQFLPRGFRRKKVKSPKSSNKDSKISAQNNEAAVEKIPDPFFAGLALGAAAIVRPTALVLLVAFTIVLWRRQALNLAASVAIGTAVVVTPVIIQNWRVTGLPMIQAYGGMNFYLGNRPSGDGAARARVGGEWDSLEGAASRAATTRNDQDAYYLRRAWNEIADQPGRYLQLLASKLLWTMQDEELRDTHSYYFFADAARWLQWLPAFGFVLPFAAIGIVMSRDPERWWLLAYLAAMIFTTVFFVVGTRYRMPLVPVLIAFAGFAIAAIVERMRLREWKTVAALAAIAVVTWSVAQLRTDASSRNLGEEWAFTGLALLQERQFDGAEAAFRTAIGLDGSSFAWDGLGLVLQRREQRSNARDAFERAVTINPANATAWLHLGLAYEFLGNGRAAIDAYEKALAITPERADAKEMLEAARRRYLRLSSHVAISSRDHL